MKKNIFSANPSAGFINRFAVPTWAEWWQSLRYVLLIFTIVVGLALLGSFVSYERVIATGHPWLPKKKCAGCPFCGMTRSFCAMSSGRWREAEAWNRGGPILYAAGWAWFSASGFIGLRLTRNSLRRLTGAADNQLAEDFRLMRFFKR